MAEELYWTIEREGYRFYVFIPPSVTILKEDAEYAALYEKLVEYAAEKYVAMLGKTKLDNLGGTFVIRPPLARYDFYKPDGTAVFGNDNFELSLSTTGEFVQIAQIAYNLENVTILNSPVDFRNKALFIKGITVPQPDPPVRILRFVKNKEYSEPIDIVAFRNERGDVILRGPPIIVYNNVLTVEGNVNATGSFIMDMAKLCVVVEPLNYAPLFIQLIAEKVK